LEKVMAKKTPLSPVARATTTAKEVATLIYALTGAALAVPSLAYAMAAAVHAVKAALN
jgi:hypothetical protein